MIRVCVFCSAAEPVDRTFADAIASFGSTIASRGDRLVYGGGRAGLMGVLADAALAGGAHVTGVIPSFLNTREIQHPGIDETIEIDDLGTRKDLFLQKSDAFVAFPGGLGTLDEVLEVITWKQLGRLKSPIVLVNLEGFFDPLLELFSSIKERGMVKESYTELFDVATDIDGVFEKIQRGVEGA